MNARSRLRPLTAISHGSPVTGDLRRLAALLLELDRKTDVRSETIGSDECAELLRCTPEQVEELARAGEIPGLKVGRSWLFVRVDLLAYLAEKARAEAQERRAKRQSTSPALTMVKPRRRRQSPPPLPPL